MMFPKCAGLGTQLTGFDLNVGSVAGTGFPKCAGLGVAQLTGLLLSDGEVGGIGLPFREVTPVVFKSRLTKPSGMKTFLNPRAGSHLFDKPLRSRPDLRVPLA